MALKDIFKVSRKTFFNPLSWGGYAEVKGTTLTIINIIRGLFIQQEGSGRTETFEQALKRLNVSEEELQGRTQNYFYFALLFFLCGILSVVFSFYLLIRHHTFAGFLLGLAAAALFESQAFRYHFWYFQIESRKLGCTFEEWRQYLYKQVGL